MGSSQPMWLAPRAAQTRRIGKDDVFDTEPLVVTIDLVTLAALRTGHPRDHLLQGAERADPTAEKSSEDRRQTQHRQPQPRPSGDRPVGQRRADCRQGVEGEQNRGDGRRNPWLGEAPEESEEGEQEERLDDDPYVACAGADHRAESSGFASNFEF